MDQENKEWNDSKTFKKETGCGSMFLTIVLDNDQGKNVEGIFFKLGKSGGCPSSWGEALCKIIALSLQKGVDVDEIIKVLIGNSCYNSIGYGKGRISSCSDAIGKILRSFHKKEEKREEDRREKNDGIEDFAKDTIDS